jgi:hypothetical protein
MELGKLEEHADSFYKSNQPSGAKQAAEKVRMRSEFAKNGLAGAKQAAEKLIV